MIFNMTGQPEKVLPVRRIEDSKKKKAIKSPWHLKATDKLNKTKPRNFWSVKNSSSLFKRNKSLEPALMALRQCRAAFRVSHLDCLLSCKCLIYISCLIGPRKDSLGARKDLHLLKKIICGSNEMLFWEFPFGKLSEVQFRGQSCSPDPHSAITLIAVTAVTSGSKMQAAAWTSG